MPEIQSPQPKRLQCRHILTDGHRCGSPCLRNESFCYYHHTTRRPAPRGGAITLTEPLRDNTHFAMPNTDDRTSIQLSIGEVLRRIANHEIDPRRAGLLLYGLQIASHNLPAEPPPQTPTLTVEDITDDPDQGLLAPEAEYQSAPREKTLEEILVAQWEREKAEALPEVRT